MISRIGRRKSELWDADPRRGFSLIELLLVLALLSIVISITLPTLSNFFRGRTLDAEARRLLSLTRYGQSRAVSEGIPMVLWVDPENRTYGLEQEPGWDDNDAKAVNLKLDDNLKVEVIRTNVVKPLLAAASPLMSAGNVDTRQNLPSIRFLPDGSIAESSLPGIRLLEKDGASLSLSQSQNRMSYEIRKESIQ
jgi:type II secretion system protein H